ncbi:MAG: tetratricopeptide repeat protein [Gemmatimonadaceae bacterium]|nr:tetratricopeptide repeat protein [Gemmatimonadaceae bacterium]
MRAPTALLAVTLLLPCVLHGQKPKPEPTRPRLDAGADTNDARSYYQYGVRMLDTKPEESSRAFYWVSRIDPTSAEALYAMRASALLEMTASGVFDYYDYSAKKRKPEYLALDSLLYRAYTINPFLYRNLDGSLMRRLIEAEFHNEDPSADGAEVNLATLNYMQQSRHTAWQSYVMGRFPEALELYGKQLKTLEQTKSKRNTREHEDDASEIHAERSRIFYLMGNMDSALTEMNAAMAGLRQRDEKETVILYESKAMYDQSLGMIHEKAMHPDLAREAYAHALEEDLSYFTAHTRMAMLQLSQGDTASALTEMDLAAQLQPNDPVLRYSYALVLIRARRDGEAATQLTKSVQADPYFAAPHLLLARMADVEQYTDDAVKEYQQFLSLAPKSDPQAATARTRLAALTATAAATPAPAAAKP